MAHHWGYGGDLVGPDDWVKYYPTGSRQSPIDILVDECSLRQHNKQAARQTTCCEIVATTLKDLNLEQSTEKRQQQQQQQPRKHLSSVGDEHPRSPSTSSSEGSVESSPQHHHHHNHHHHHHHRSDDDARAASSIRYHRKHNGQGQCNCKAHEYEYQNTRRCVSNKKIFIGYPRYLNSMKLCNTGHNWQIDLPPELSAHTLLCGPPLGDREYRLLQLHCHWGEDCDHGSEHTINGRSYAAEIHFVHWNCSQFKSAEEASKHKNGLAVMAVLVQALDGEQNRNKHLDKIIAGLPSIQTTDSSVTLNTRLDLKKLFPANRWTYATYEGSLTTPPLSEVVNWIVFLQPIQCSTSQIEQFRHIKCPSGNLLKNCRPVQPLNNRIVSIWTHH